MGLEYKEFMNANNACFENGFKDMVIVPHEYDIGLFKKNYEDNCKEDGVKIYRQDDSYKLRLGFVVDDGNSKVWHTVRLSAFKIDSSSCKSKES